MNEPEKIYEADEIIRAFDVDRRPSAPSYQSEAVAASAAFEAKNTIAEAGDMALSAAAVLINFERYVQSLAPIPPALIAELRLIQRGISAKVLARIERYIDRDLGPAPQTHVMHVEESWRK